MGASALSPLLQYNEPAEDQRKLPCPCGHTAPFVELRSKILSTAVGQAELRRPYYLCAHCGEGQFPVDDELDVSKTMKSPGLRRMLGAVGQEAPFERGSQHMKLLAGLEITAKEVERTAEAIGEDIARRERHEIQRAMPLDLPVVVGEAIPDPVCANGRDGDSSGEKRNCGPAGQPWRSTGTHTTSQVGMRVYPNQMG